MISEGFNHITAGEIQKAILDFERLKEIPILSSDASQAHKFFRHFEEAEPELKWLVLDVVVAVSKCMYIDAMTILHEFPDGQL